MYCRTIAPIVLCVYISLFFNYDVRVLVFSKITTEVSDQLALMALQYNSFLATSTGFMAVHGSIGEFSVGSETWVSYIERLQQYFVANDIKGDDKQRAVLLSVCGASTYQLIRSVVSPAKPTEKTFEQLVTLMKEHYFPKPSVTMQRFAFNSSSHKQGESVANFVADLRRLSEYCEFGESLAAMLRDRLICGINNDRMQRHLLAESKLSFEKAYELAQAMETADHDAKELQGPPTAAVNKLTRGTGKHFSTGMRQTTSPMTHKNLKIIATAAGESIPLTIAAFINQSANSARKLVTLKEHAAPSSNRVREEKEILPAKLITCNFPVMIQPMVANQRDQMNIQCIMSGVATPQ